MWVLASDQRVYTKSESTVLDIFKKCAKQAISPHGGLVRVLGVDEISVGKGHKNYALVLSDLEQRCVIAVLPDRQKDTLEKWLDDLTEQERQAIKVVSMDMWRPYRSAVRTKLPHAQIVADRFHVMKQLNYQIDLLRRSLQRNADETLAKALKGSRWILLKRRSKFTADEEAQLRIILDACDEHGRQFLPTVGIYFGLSRHCVTGGMSFSTTSATG